MYDHVSWNVSNMRFWSTFNHSEYQFTNHVIKKSSNMQFWSIFNCSNGPKVHIRSDWRWTEIAYSRSFSHVIRIFGEKVSGPNSWRPVTWLLLSQSFLSQNLYRRVVELSRTLPVWRCTYFEEYWHSYNPAFSKPLWPYPIEPYFEKRLSIGYKNWITRSYFICESVTGCMCNACPTLLSDPRGERSISSWLAFPSKKNLNRVQLV